MKSLLFLTLTVLYFLPIQSVRCQTQDYKFEEDFNMTIKGSSNVHDWESKIGSMKATASISINQDGEVQINACNVSIPVKSIKSSKGSIMDKKMMKAFNEEEYPMINYKLTAYDNIEGTDKVFKGIAIGDLTIAGVTKSIAMNIAGNLLDNGSYEITGVKDMKMTDFDISPPTALMGAMKTRDEISIEFRVQLVSP